MQDSGGDTFLSVAITMAAVYTGGHQRWLNNPYGSDFAGAGAVPRAGLNAIDPNSGEPFSWNPGRNPRGAGAGALLATSAGLWVGSDTDYIGNYKYLRPKIAFFPLAGGQVPPKAQAPVLPSNVYLGGPLPGSSNSNILYRVNAGGPAIQATDNGPDWADDSANDSPYRNSGSNSATWSPVPNVDSTVPASTPSAIFDSERWSPSDNPPDGLDLPGPGQHPG